MISVREEDTKIHAHLELSIEPDGETKNAQGCVVKRNGLNARSKTVKFNCLLLFNFPLFLHYD